MIEERGEPLAIVLDDVHALAGEEALTSVAGLSRVLPEGCKLVLASRAEPAIGVPRLRADGRLDEIRAADMAMTRGEATRAFAAVGRELDRDLVVGLVEATEGWPAALQLAGMTLDDGADPATVVRELAGDERLIADYLRAEVIAGLEPEDREFLVRASVLDALDGDVCDAVLGCSGSGRTLRRLSRANLLLSPLDGRDFAFRMHALLRGMLRAELRRSGAEVEADLHRRAADWYRGRDDDLAAEHAIATGDVEFASERIWRLGAVYAGMGRRATVASWMSSFTDADVEGAPGLAVVAAACAVADGDGAAIARNVSAAAAATKGDRAPDPELLGAAETLRLVQDSSGDLLAAAGRLDELHDLISGAGPWGALCRFVAGSLHHLSGDRGAARERFEDAIRSGAVRAPAVQAVSIAGATLLALDEERIGDAERLSADGLAKIELYGIEAYAASALSYALEAQLRARRGESRRTGEVLLKADETAASTPVVNEWFGAEIRVALARAHLLAGDPDTARRWLGEAAAMGAGVRGLTVLAGWVDDLREELDAGAGAGRWPLTPAELRLLRVLPTHLSFPEVAERLFVSTNTVKTQARSIYRKLGVSSRSEAVEAARAGGLLDRDRAGSPRSD
jgi:LuxR family maltose regulon positive regulatory protein